jgi:hypothetical protein
MFEVSALIITGFFSLLRYINTTQENKNYTTKQDRAIWRLVHKTDDEISADEEVVVSFQGILCKKDMAPYNEKNMCA